MVHGWALSMGMRVFDSHVDPVVPFVRTRGVVGRPCPPCSWSLSNVGSDRAWTTFPSYAWREETPYGVVVGVGWILGTSPSVAFPFPRGFEKDTEGGDVPFQIPIDLLSYGSTPSQPAQTKRGTKAIDDTSERTSTGGGETQRWPRAWWKKRR